MTAYVEEQRNRKAAVSRRKPRTLVRRDAGLGSLASLPQSITLSRCRLEVSFGTLEELAQSLYALAQAMETDGDAMALLYEAEPVPEPTLEDDGVDAMFRDLEASEAQRPRDKARRCFCAYPVSYWRERVNVQNSTNPHF